MATKTRLTRRAQLVDTVTGIAPNGIAIDMKLWSDVQSVKTGVHRQVQVVEVWFGENYIAKQYSGRNLDLAQQQVDEMRAAVS